MGRNTAALAATGLALGLALAPVAASPAAAGEAARPWLVDVPHPSDTAVTDHILAVPAVRRTVDLRDPASLVALTDPAYTDQAAGWCARGAIFSTVFAVGFAVPAIASGAAAPLGAAELAATAGSGCGFSMLWGAAISGAVWAAQTYFIEPSLAVPAPSAPTREAAVDGDSLRVAFLDRLTGR